MDNINSEIKNGLYTCETVDIISGMNSESHKTELWKMRVLEGQFKDGVIDKWYTLRTNEARNFLQKELALTGLSVSSGAELEEKKSELQGKRVLVQVKINTSGYPNFYIKGLAPSKEAEKLKPNTSVDW